MTTLERNVEDRFRSATDLQWLRAYLTGLLDGDVDREDLEIVLRHVHEHFRDVADERSADLVLDGLDLVTGWCGPGMEIPAQGSLS